MSKTTNDETRSDLILEYRDAHEWGRHWDLLRWNVSKFFLSIQTVFAIAALKGLLMLEESPTTTERVLLVFNQITPEQISSKTDKFFWGLAGLSIINIFLCIIWTIRNLGIHDWHCAAIKRQEAIEKTSKNAPAFFSEIKKRLKYPPHITGDLECWGTPTVFSALWLGVIILAGCFSKQSCMTIIILLLALALTLALLFLFVAKCISCKYRRLIPADKY